jgi:hypothetical protein
MKTRSLFSFVSVLSIFLLVSNFALANPRHTEPAKPVPVKIQPVFTNSIIYNDRPNGWTFEMPVIAITHGGTTDYYYLDVIVMNNGTNFSFDLPNISGVTSIALYNLSEHNLEDSEYATLSTNGGGSTSTGSVVHNENWFNFIPAVNITNGVVIHVY